jgi:hypothetical protein
VQTSLCAAAISLESLGRDRRRSSPAPPTAIGARGRPVGAGLAMERFVMKRPPTKLISVRSLGRASGDDDNRPATTFYIKVGACHFHAGSAQGRRPEQPAALNGGDGKPGA